jgi:hypothetical protein
MALTPFEASDCSAGRSSAGEPGTGSRTETDAGWV